MLVAEGDHVTATNTVPVPLVVVGIDTHSQFHHAAALDAAGRVLADRQFDATTRGHDALTAWIQTLGTVETVGVESTGAYGAALTRHLQATGLRVVEVGTKDATVRARRGKDDRLDAITAAHQVLAGAGTTPKDTTGIIESIRVLTVVRDRAVKDRTAALNEIAALRVTAPAGLREELAGLSNTAVAKQAATWTVDRSQLADPHTATRIALSRLGARIAALNVEIADADRDLAALTSQAAPTLLARPGVGPHCAARLLICAAQNIDRLHNEASLARLTGTAPIPASSGKTHRMRLSRSGDRQANRALHMIALNRLRYDPRTQAFRDRRLAQGDSRRDTLRVLKRHLVREIYRALTTDLDPQRP